MGTKKNDTQVFLPVQQGHKAAFTGAQQKHQGTQQRASALRSFAGRGRLSALIPVKEGGHFVIGSNCAFLLRQVHKAAAKTRTRTGSADAHQREKMFCRRAWQRVGPLARSAFKPAPRNGGSGWQLTAH